MSVMRCVPFGLRKALMEQTQQDQPLVRNSVYTYTSWEHLVNQSDSAYVMFTTPERVTQKARHL